MIAGESKDDQSFGRAKSACHLKSHEPGVVNDWDNRSTLDARFIPRSIHINHRRAGCDVPSLPDTPAADRVRSRGDELAEVIARESATRGDSRA